MNFQQTDGGRPEHEQNDCAVRAISLAANIPYAEAHKMLKDAGRKDGHKFRFVYFMCGIPQLGNYFASPCATSVGAKTVNQLLKMKLAGRYIVRTRGHVFAMVDGVVHDILLEGPRRQIKNLWRLRRLSPGHKQRARRGVDRVRRVQPRE